MARNQDWLCTQPPPTCSTLDSMEPTAAEVTSAFEHLGWKFQDRTDFHARAARYIAEGLAHNYWIEFVGHGSREQLWAELTALPGIADRLTAGGVGVTPASKFYAVLDGTDIVDPHTAVAISVAALDHAIQNGYNGFRVVVDATTLARRPDQRAALSQFEFLLSRTMTGLPFSALCAYDTHQLAGVADELICLHPDLGERAPRFRLHPAPQATFALTGNIDLHSDGLYTTALQRIWSLLDDDPLIVIDAQGLEFISHQQLYTLDHYARANGRTVILRTGQRIPTRLVGVLQLTNVELQPAPPHNATQATGHSAGQVTYAGSAG